MNRRSLLGAALAAPALAVPALATQSDPEADLLTTFRRLGDKEQSIIMDLVQKLTPEAHARRAAKAKKAE